MDEAVNSHGLLHDTEKASRVIDYSCVGEMIEKHEADDNIQRNK